MPVAQKGGIVKVTGKKALITSGKSGIGLATARLFIAEGAVQSADEALMQSLPAALR
jgi:NADP-dependent 3-hydroxy acid dehydrogenase YdfG